MKFMLNHRNSTNVKNLIVVRIVVVVVTWCDLAWNRVSIRFCSIDSMIIKQHHRTPTHRSVATRIALVLQTHWIPVLVRNLWLYRYRLFDFFPNLSSFVSNLLIVQLKFVPILQIQLKMRYRLKRTLPSTMMFQLKFWIRMMKLSVNVMKCNQLTVRLPIHRGQLYRRRGIIKMTMALFLSV